MKLSDIVRAAIHDILQHGYDSEDRIARWKHRLREGMQSSMVPLITLKRKSTRHLTDIYNRVTNPKGLLRKHKGISAYTLARIRPELRAELDRRIMSNANLIKLNRQASIERTLQRFEGWATSIPAGGTKAYKKRPIDTHLRKAFQSLPFEERRVIIDQGHKLSAALNDIVAKGGDAIAAIWHSHWRETGYDYRPRHKQFDERVFVIRDNWALKAGLMKLGGSFYTDQIEGAGEAIFCRCYYQYLYTPESLPDYLLTEKGREYVKRGKANEIKAG